MRIRMLVFSSLLLVSCANVTFHPEANRNSPDLNKQTGLKYYTAKPYLLVGPTGNKDAPLKAEIISLPDLEHPTYAIYHPGWGQHIFSLAVSSNGSLSSYGQTADSKIPETIAAVGSLMSGGGTLATALKSAGFAPAPTPKAFVQQAIEELKQLAKIESKDDLVLQKIQKANQIETDLESMNGNYTDDGLTPISKAIGDLKFENAQADTVPGKLNERLNNAKRNIDAAIEGLKPPSSKKARLYEITMEGGKTKLTEVKIPSED
jgi:hypothetical protein